MTLRVNRKLKYEIPLKIDIGCKENTKHGFTGIDILDFGQDVIWDVLDGLPFPDNSVEEIYCSHFLEHLKVDQIQDFFCEMHRVCKEGSQIEVKVPHSDCIESYYSCHFSRWNEDRIKGIMRGLNGVYTFDIKKMYRKTIELIVFLIVRKSE